MEKTEVLYRRKPAFVSFLGLYMVCILAALLLITYSRTISMSISVEVLEKLEVSKQSLIWNFPFGVVFAVPFAYLGIRRLLWNVMSFYEIDSKEIRLVVGSISRKEHHVPLSNLYDISFKQNLFEAPFQVGSLILTSLKSGSQMILSGVHDVKQVVDVLRTKSPNTRK
jgi:uncharacterized membrane protein YdbT with pleckstrin-like domain